MPAVRRPDFERAIEKYRFGRAVLDPADIAAACRSVQLDNHLLLGELHGVEQTADVLYQLVKTTGARVLGLEWPADEFDGMARSLLAGRDLDWAALWSDDSNGVFRRGDGRVTAGHFAALQRLVAEGHLEELIFFDAPNESREQGMAERLLQSWPRDLPLIAAVGAGHVLSTDELMGTSPALGKDSEETMADYLAEQLTTTNVALLAWDSGSGWHHGEYRVPPCPTTSKLKIRLGAGCPATVPLPTSVQPTDPDPGTQGGKT